VALRKQYHFRPGPDGLRAWSVDRLIELARDLPVRDVPLTAIAEIDEAYWFGHGEQPTVRAVADHARLIAEADLAYPILLSSDGRVMDGMHRVARALILQRATVPARQFATDPEPDHVGVAPEDLAY
jgi:hypothetical protein